MTKWFTLALIAAVPLGLAVSRTSRRSRKQRKFHRARDEFGAVGAAVRDAWLDLPIVRNRR